MMKIIALFAVFMAASTVSTGGQTEPDNSTTPALDLDGLAVATFASGCFWCVEAIYESLEGVDHAVSGYSGGQTDEPTYQEVGGGRTGHAESVQVTYDPEVISFQDLVDVYFMSQDPTQANGQGPDRGAAYRSIIFYRTDEERRIAEEAKAELAASGKYTQPIAAEIEAFSKFWEAEAYHQDFERRNPNHPYVRNVSIPRLERFQQACPLLLK